MAGQTKFYHFLSVCNNFRTLFINRPLVNHTQVATIRAVSKEALKNIPEKPKKPLTPFFIYSQTRREEIKKTHPNIKITEVAKLLADEWKTADNSIKQKYDIEYKNAMTDYLKKRLDYNSKLTEDQRNVLKQVAREKAKERKNRKTKKTLKELNKPKRPKGPYLYFALEYYAKDKSKYNSYTEFLKHSKSIWEALPENEKQKYQDMYLDDKKRYELEMDEWEAKMVSEGRIDVVRHDTLAASSKPKRIIQPKSATAVKEKPTKRSTATKSKKPTTTATPKKHPPNSE